MAMTRTAFEAAIEKKRAVRLAEENNPASVADSMGVRLSLMSRVRAGEITLIEAQKQLKKIQRDATKNGLVTRAQVFNEA
jgi:hypothetical protein